MGLSKSTEAPSLQISPLLHLCGAKIGCAQIGVETEGSSEYSQRERVALLFSP